MKIFVTGGSSYLGIHMVPYLSKRHHEVCYSWLSTPPEQGALGTPVQVDVRNREQLSAVIEQFQPDALIHLAASNRSSSEDEMVSSIEGGAEAITKIAQKLSLRLIHMSTDVVFDGSASPYSEDAPVSPPHAYGRAKAQAEKIVGSYERGVIIRPSLIYSLERKDRSTEWIEDSLNAGKEVTLFTDQIRMPVSTDTLSGACLELINHDFSGILHIVGRQPLSRAEIGQRMLDWWEISNRETLKFVPTPPDAPWPKELTMDISLAEKILKTPLLGMDEIIGNLS